MPSGCALVAAAHTTDLLPHANILLADASGGVPHGAISQFEKASLVAKLRATRERRAAAGGRGSGRFAPGTKHPSLLAQEVAAAATRARNSLRRVAGKSQYQTKSALRCLAPSIRRNVTLGYQTLRLGRGMD